MATIVRSLRKCVVNSWNTIRDEHSGEWIITVVVVSGRGIRRCGTTVCSWGKKCNCEKDVREGYRKDLVGIEWYGLPGGYHRAGHSE